MIGGVAAALGVAAVGVEGGGGGHASDRDHRRRGESRAAGRRVLERNLGAGGGRRGGRREERGWWGSVKLDKLTPSVFIDLAFSPLLSHPPRAFSSSFFSTGF
jgi:hypothetical protein